VTSAPLVSGQVVAAYGRRFLVETDAGSLSCIVRGRTSEVVCGDRVAVRPDPGGEGVIEAVDPRSSLFLRSAPHRTKPIAANVSQVAVVVATDPSFSDEMVARALAAAEHQRLKSCIVLNKLDLPAQDARLRLEPFAAAGCRIVETSALADIGALRNILQGQTTLLVGQSGMGKSTLVNALVPAARAKTREISKFLASGRHTTANVTLYRLDAASAIVDAPGMQEFGLAHLDPRDIERGFVEFVPLLGQCRFPDCRHAGEPGCALAAAAAEARIHPRRLELFRRIVAAERGSGAAS
jgi:ribosome biogenesis GTPase / thiamine phosphate phosphatase